MFYSVHFLHTAKLLGKQNGDPHLHLFLGLDKKLLELNLVKYAEKSYLYYDQTLGNFLSHDGWIPHGRFCNFE